MFSVNSISLQHLPFSVITVEFNAASNTFERKSTKLKDEVTVGGAASCDDSLCGIAASDSGVVCRTPACVVGRCASCMK